MGGFIELVFADCLANQSPDNLPACEEKSLQFSPYEVELIQYQHSAQAELARWLVAHPQYATVGWYKCEFVNGNKETDA